MRDLTAVKDHPAEILAGTPARVLTRFEAQGLLRAHEQAHNVTFVALDDDTLEAVDRAYRDWQGAPSESPAELDASHAFLDAVRDLLGLDVDA